MTLEELENQDDGWVEWPNFTEPEENKFDWSLSYEQMEKHYPPANFYKESLELKSIIVPYTSKRKRANWFKQKKEEKYNKPKEAVEKKRHEVTKGKYINYQGADCPCVGFVSKSIGHGIKQYQNAYYHAGEEKYVFQAYDGVMAFHKETVGKYIKPFFPDAKDVGLSVNSNVPRTYPKKLEKTDDGKVKLIEGPHPKDDCREIWQTEMIKDGEWVREKRYYYAPKSIINFDLFIMNKRRNVKRLCQEENIDLKVKRMLAAPEENFHESCE